MKQLTSISLLIIYLAGMFRPILPYLEYAVNKDEIASEYCVNKDKPELKCNGQCYLMQQLKVMASEQESDSSSEIPPIVSAEEVLFAHIQNGYSISIIDALWVKKEVNQLLPILPEVYLAIPKPPPRLS